MFRTVLATCIIICTDKMLNIQVCRKLDINLFKTPPNNLVVIFVFVILSILFKTTISQHKLEIFRF